MTNGERDPNTWLPLTPAVFHILLVLADGERHGYGIMQEVKAQTEGRVRLGAGTLYGAIKRLMAGGLIAEAGEGTDPDLSDERRRYYRLTDFGLRVAQVEAQRLEQLVRLARGKQWLMGPELGTDTGTV